MVVKFAKAARRHTVGKASAVHVLETATPVEIITAQGNAGLLYVGRDERGRELEIITTTDRDDETIELVIHVMPTALRKKRSR